MGLQRARHDQAQQQQAQVAENRGTNTEMKLRLCTYSLNTEGLYTERQKSLKLMSKISHKGISILPKADREEICMGSEKFSGQSKTNFSF